MRRLDIAVAGCGPAGLAVALFLARQGHRVVLFERFAVPRPIGSGLMLQPTGLAALRELGLAEAAIARGARVERLFGRALPAGRVVLDVRYAALSPPAFGLGIHRADLFGLLFDAAEAAGITIETGRTVAATERAAGDRRRLVFADGTRSAPFCLVVDTLGTASPLSRVPRSALPFGALWASLDAQATSGLDPAALEQRYRRANVMVGVLPTGPMSGAGRKVAFFWSLPGDALGTWRQDGLDSWRNVVASLWPEVEPLLAQIVDPEQLTFARYAHRTHRQPAEAGLIHLGDAWHATSPQLGQGANMALLDARALDVALRSSSDVQFALSRAVALRRRHVHLYQAMSLLLTPVYQSNGTALPFLRDRAAGPLSSVPPFPRLLATMVAGLIGGPFSGLQLSGP